MGQAAAALAHTVGDPCCEQENGDYVAHIPVKGQTDESDSISTNVGDVFSVTLTRTRHMKLGLDLDFVPTREAIPVRAITGALAEEWNREHQDAQVLPGDRIVEVNGTRGTAEQMMKALKDSEEVRMTLVRLKTSKGTDDWEYLQTYHTRLEFEENMPDALYELVPYQGDQVNVATSGFGEAVTGQLKSTATVIPWGGQVGGAVSIIPTGSEDGQNPDSMPEPEPRPAVAVIQDPRSSNNREVGVVGFHYPGQEEAWDRLCQAGFLGNSFDLGDEEMQLETPCEPGAKRPFQTAEAAFQALRFWCAAEEFSSLSGEEAVLRGQQLGGQEDLTYAGFGSAWKGMLAVLNAKFRPSSLWASSLLKTRDALLLDRASAVGNSGPSEDNNWVGLQLMLIRDQLSGESKWTEYIANLVDLDTGEAHAAATSLQWLLVVRSAAQALDDAVELGPEAPDTLGEDEFGEMVSISRPMPPFAFQEDPRPIGSPLDSASQTDTPSEVPPSSMSRNGSKRSTPDF